MSRGAVAILVAALGAGAVSRAGAQELEPRAYSPNPTGANFVVVGIGRSTGDVVTDPSLPFQDVEAKLNQPTLGYSHTLGLFGRSASIGLGVPYVWGSVEGSVGEEARRITRSGLADPRLRFAVNLVGGPALDPREFAARRPRTSLGATVIVSAPLGQYDPAKLVNLGTNRWAVKGELGVSQPLGRFAAELYAGGWLYGDNDDFYGGVRREQKPVATLQAHVVYTIRPRLWLAGDATFYAGGSTTLDGTPKNDRQQNSRVGLTLALPVARRQSLKVTWGSGFTTLAGGDFQTIGVAWQFFWFN